MPRTPKQFQAMQDESRAQLVQAALELFAEKGFENTSVSAIARRAELSQGLMYNYFASKDELLLAIFEKGWNDVQLSFHVPLRKGREKPSLYDFIENACRLTLKHQDFWRLVHTIRAQPAALERIGESIRTFETMILTQLEAFCTASLPALPEYSSQEMFAHPQVEARLIFALVDGICTHCLRQPTTYPLDEVLSFLKPLYDSRFL